MLNKLMCNLRSIAFWTLDKLKGSKIQTSYKEIKMIDELDSTDEFIQQYHEKKFEKLRLHAVETTQFYSILSEESLLTNFPVINKNIIRDNQKAFISMNYELKNLFEMSTSGSTGTPFICYQDNNKKRRVNAEIIYYSEKAGYSVGSNLIYLRALTNISRKSIFHQWIQNQTLLNISELDDKKIESLLAEIGRVSRNGSMVLAYASTLDALKDYFYRNGVSATDNSNISGIVSSSEMLFDETRSTIKEAFECNVISRYSNQENGVIAQDHNVNNTFILNEANYIVEILDLESDKVVPEGAIGRIVITDLYNFAMPLIRYDTGDIGSMVTTSYNGVGKKAISNFGGRKIDVVYDSNGKRLSPHIITNNFWDFPEIEQFQFIQKNKTQYVAKINVKNDFKKINEVELMLRTLLGEKANINVELVNEIPELSSGKRKYVINESNLIQ